MIKYKANTRRTRNLDGCVCNLNTSFSHMSFSYISLTNILVTHSADLMMWTARNNMHLHAHSIRTQTLATVNVGPTSKYAATEIRQTAQSHNHISTFCCLNKYVFNFYVTNWFYLLPRLQYNENISSSVVLLQPKSIKQTVTEHVIVLDRILFT